MTEQNEGQQDRLSARVVLEAVLDLLVDEYRKAANRVTNPRHRATCAAEEQMDRVMWAICKTLEDLRYEGPAAERCQKALCGVFLFGEIVIEEDGD